MSLRYCFLIAAVVLGNAVPAHAQEIFKQDILYFNHHLNEVVHDTQNFNFTPYTDYNSALASHCQIFKEQGQELWWANCGKPINGFTVISNVDSN